MTPRPTRLPRLLLVCLCLALWLPGFFTLPPGDRDESRFAQATKQMIGSGDYVRIMNGTEARLRKPVGIYWLQIPGVMAVQALRLAKQNPIWPYRLPSLLGAIAAVLAAFDIALTLTADRRTALLAGAMLAGCVILTVEAHIAKTDAALLGATSWAMAVLARAWMGKSLGRAEAAIFWLMLGAGILIKGPITPMVAALCVLTLAIWTRSFTWLRALRPAWGVPLMLAVVLPWLAAIEWATHGAFLAQSVGGDLGSKLAGGSESHGGFFGEHLLLLPLLAFPSGLAVISALPAAWRGRGTPAARFLIAWVLPSWLVFELTPTKLPHYTLPLYPALCIAAASWHFAGVRDEAGQEFAAPSQRRRLAPSGGGFRAPERSGLFGREHRSAENRLRMAGAVEFLPSLDAPPRWLGVMSGFGLWLAAAILGLGGVALAAYLHGPWWLALPAVPAAMAAAWFAQMHRPWPALLAAIPLYATILFLTLPNVDRLWIAPRIEAALYRDWPGWNANGAGLAVAGYAEPSLMFETGADTLLLPDGKAAAEALANGKISIVLVERRTDAAFLSAAAARHMTVQKIDEIDGFNPSRGRDVVLDFYRRRLATDD